MIPPTMPAWNLALRFGLELGALAGIGLSAWNLTSGPARLAASALAPTAAAVLWGVFNVHDDPSRSGAAPIEVSGWVRLAIEFLVLGGGATAIAFAGHRSIAIVFALVIALHYALSSRRVEWLVQQSRSA